ncbi:MAG: hypothetical protein QNJ40_11040 [Xanthomonadales bacterium]|nr:hypothetical protein [Xanthomonadales bacterium]
MDADRVFPGFMLLVVLAVIVAYQRLLAPSLSPATAAWISLGALAASAGGCAGTLHWLSAETSGSGSSVSPLIWLGLMVGGLTLFGVNRAAQRRGSKPNGSDPNRPEGP